MMKLTKENKTFIQSMGDKEKWKLFQNTIK